MGTLHLPFPSTCPHFPAPPWTPEGWPWWNASPSLLGPLAFCWVWPIEEPLSNWRGGARSYMFTLWLPPCYTTLWQCPCFLPKRTAPFRQPLRDSDNPCQVPIPNPCPSWEAVASCWFGCHSAPPILIKVSETTSAHTVHLLQDPDRSSTVSICRALSHPSKDFEL